MGWQKKWKEILVISLMGLVWWWQERPDGNLHVVFCDVGQGDAILVSQGEVEMLIDTGPGEAVMGCLDEQIPFWDKKIEVVVISHEDRDHIGGLDKVMEEYEVEKLVINGVRSGNEDSEEVRELVRELGVEVKVAERGDRIVMGEVEMEFWWPEEEQSQVLAWRDGDEIGGKGEEGGNEMSLVGLLSYGDFEVLLTGDISEAEELAMERMGVLRKVEVLKVAHHGSKFSSSESFLKEVRPDEAVIMVGEKNSFGHPSSEVLMRLEAVESRVWRTDQVGDIEIVSDGLIYWIGVDME